MKTIRIIGMATILVIVCSLMVACSSDDEEEDGGKGLKGKHEYVDLGLPSGTLWATCNVGANSPEEYGDYFAWGEIEGIPSNIDIDTYTFKWCPENFGNNYIKYCGNSRSGDNGYTDDKTELDLEDDAAYMNWGSKWRIPNKEQWKELIHPQFTICTWTTLNGVNGCKITSVKNGKSIFLPAAGNYGATRHLVYKMSVGQKCCYWPRTFSQNNPHYTGCFSGYKDDISWYPDFDRLNLASVRPVRNLK